MKALSEIDNFGKIAAEDDDLRRFFLRTPIFQEVITGERQIVVGRKGSGKSALYLAVMNSAEGSDYFAEGLTFGDYPWALHAKYASESRTAHERFLPSWRFLIYMQIFKVLLTEQNRASRYRGEAAKALSAVEGFIQRNYGLIAFDHRKTFPGGGFHLDGLTIGPEVAGLSLGAVEVGRDKALGDSLERLNEWLKNALAAVAATAPKIVTHHASENQ